MPLRKLEHILSSHPLTENNNDILDTIDFVEEESSRNKNMNSYFPGEGWPPLSYLAQWKPQMIICITCDALKNLKFYGTRVLDNLRNI